MVQVWPLVAFSLVALPSQLLRRTHCVVSEGEEAWLVLGGQIHHYDASNDQWTVLGRGLATGSARELWLDGEFLWATVDSGVCYAPRGSEQWVCFGKESGLMGALGPLVFAQDYVWGATERGIARFDRYIEEWILYGRAEYGLPSDSVTALLLDGSYLWAATRGGIGRLDTGLEQWEGFPEVSMGGYHDAVGVGGRLWFLWESGATVHNTQSRVFEELGRAEGLGAGVLVHEEVGSELWLLTDDGILVCDPDAGICVPLAEAEYLAGVAVRDMSFAGSKLWLATDHGVYRYWPDADPSRGEHLWKAYTRSQGLTASSYVRVEAAAGGVFALAEDGLLDYMPDEAEERWRTRASVEAGGGGDAWLRLDEQGLRLLGPGAARMAVSGTASRLERWQWDGDRWRQGRNRVELALLEEVGMGRFAAGFYDNTDREHERYGMRWEGTESDVLREAAFGWVQPAGPPDALVGPPESRAGHVQLDFGARTPRFGRSLASVKGWRGRMTARHGESVFLGSGNFYRLEHRDLVPGTVEVRVDGQLLATADYTLDHTTGTLLLTFSGSELVDGTTEIAVRYQYRVTEGEEMDAGGASIAVGPSDQVAASAGFTTWWEGGRWRTAGEVGGELRAGGLVVRPRLGMADRGAAAGLEALGRSSWLRVQAKHEWFDKRFPRLRPRSSLADTVIGSRSLALRVEPRWWVPFSAGYELERGVAGNLEEEWGQIELKHPDAPALGLRTLRRWLGAKGGGEVEKIEGFTTWEVPSRLMRGLRLRKLTTRARLTRGRLEGWGKEDRTVAGEFAQVVLSPAPSLFLDGVVRKVTQETKTRDLVLARNTKVAGGLRSLGLVPGLAIRGALSSTVAEDSFTVVRTRRLVAANVHELLGRISPAAWWQAASFLDGDVTYSATREDSFPELPRGTGRWDVLIGGGGPPEATIQSRLLQGRLYLRPFAGEEIVLSARDARSPSSKVSTLTARSVYDPASSLRLAAEASVRREREPPGWVESERYTWWKVQTEARRGLRGLGRVTLAGERHSGGGPAANEIQPSFMIEVWGETLEIRGEAGVTVSWQGESDAVEYWQSIRADLALGANLASRFVLNLRQKGGGGSGAGEGRIVIQL